MADLTTQETYDTGIMRGRAVFAKRPGMWSYSSLKEVEHCPRKFSLSRADYPDLWDQHGYPRAPILATIKGDVVHGALEIVVKALVVAGCSTVRSAGAVSVLRALGGYTTVAEGVLAKTLARLDGNPRVSSDRREHLTRALHDWLPEAREQIQTYLSRTRFHGGETSRPETMTPSLAERAARYPARAGDHPEIELVADGLRLKGRVDLLAIDANGVQITDFKTGSPDPCHHDQLRLYALLWSSDSGVNPDGLAVSALVAAYPGHEEAFPGPTGEELFHIRSDIEARIVAADQAVSGGVPNAVVGDHCGVCNVRALCDRYWTTKASRTANVMDGAWYDLEGTVVREHGVKSWVLREAHTNHEVLVRTPTPSFTLPVGRGIRILGARRAVDLDGGDALIAVVTSVSEVIQLNQ